MNIIAKTTSPDKQVTHCAVVFSRGNTLLPSTQNIDNALDGFLKALIARGDLGKKPGDTLLFPSPIPQTKFQRVLIVQLGAGSSKNAPLNIQDLRQAVTHTLAKLKQAPISDATLFLDELAYITCDEESGDMASLVEWIATQAIVQNYRYNTTKAPQNTTSIPVLKKITIACERGALSHYKKAITRGSAIGEGTNYTRELGNLPGNICTPDYLLSEAKALANQTPKLTCRSVSEKQMEKLGMGAFLSVSKGSSEDGHLIIMNYQGGNTKTAPIVLVGKGVTFDTGGISLKPGAGMDEMKFDMCGAASVFGVMRALTAMKAPINVIGVVAAAENMPAGHASKPGDVVTSMSGKTIEILNTDAEGRLVLCDALTYVERFKPKAVIDIATLTGACVIALGNHATGLYANQQALADDLIDAGLHTNDKAWQMPLWDDYQKQLDSNFADMANIGGRNGGSVTAACFLSRFTAAYPWAHLDIAGTAWHSGKNKGATGRPVALLMRYILNAS